MGAHLSEEVRPAEKLDEGVWSLTAKAKGVGQVDPQEVLRRVRAQDAKGGEEEDTKKPPEQEEWKRDLHAILTQKLDPAAFERLVQRVLRESGFIQVEVTGRSGDGGIDGRGIARIHGLMSFHVLFQCKRYKGAVSPSEIRDFVAPWWAGRTRGCSSRPAPSAPAR